MIYNQIRLFFWLLIHGMTTSSIIIWFVDYHAFFPALFGKVFKKKVLTIVGGFDAVSIPSIKFGIFYKNNFRARVARHVYKSADYILPVHESLIEGVNFFADPTGQGYKTGVKSFVKKIRAEFLSLPTVYDPEFWKPLSIGQRLRAVATIASVGDMKTFQRKGLDVIFEIAKVMQDVDFTIIGIKNSIYSELLELAPSNVHIIKFIPQEELPSMLSRHKVYIQLSLSEGLPNALCEAMLCQCIPVGSDVNGIPYAIGDTGYILKERNKDHAIDLVLKALESEEEKGERARQRIMTLFPLKLREQKLLKILNR